MIGAQSGSNPGAVGVEYIWFGVVLVALFLFGWWYDGVVSRAQRTEELTPFVALYVVGGVVVTLIGMGVVSLIIPRLNAFVVGLPCFAASGLMMVRGSMRRYAETVAYSKSKLRGGKTTNGNEA